MPDVSPTPFKNPNEPYFGQGVRNFPEPPDPFEKAEKGMPVNADTAGTPPQTPVETMKLEQKTSELPNPLPQKEPAAPVPFVAPAITPAVVNLPVPSPVPTESTATIPKEPAVVAPLGTIPDREEIKAAETPQTVSKTPPQIVESVAKEAVVNAPAAPLNAKYENYSADFTLPKKRRFSPWLLIIPAAFTLTGITIYGVFYFLNSSQKESTPEDVAPALVLVESSPSATGSPSAQPKVPAKALAPAENGFGVLPKFTMDNLAIAGLGLGGTVVANDATPSALPQKAKVFAFSGDYNLASASAYFSPDHPDIIPLTPELTPDQFDSQVSEQSLYPIKETGAALSEISSSSKLYGVSGKKLDWTKNKLQSLQITNYYLIYYYPPNSRFWYPLYIFEGNGVLVGDAKESVIKMKFFLPALAE